VTKFNIFNPTTPLDSEFRVRKALEGAQAAAFTTAGIHALGGGLFLATGKAVGIWLPHLGFALLAGLLGALVRWRPTPWLTGLILAWAVVEIPLTRPGLIWLRVVMILLAYQGLRGALASRKLKALVDVF
jgi:hypothetical protein